MPKLSKEEFFLAVAKLTLDHNVENDKAVVYANKLGDLLDQVDDKWYEKVTKKG